MELFGLSPQVLYFLALIEQSIINIPHGFIDVLQAFELSNMDEWIKCIAGIIVFAEFFSVAANSLIGGWGNWYPLGQSGYLFKGGSSNCIIELIIDSNIFLF